MNTVFLNMFELNRAKPAKSHHSSFSQIGIDQGENGLTELSAAVLRHLPLLEQLLLGGKSITEWARRRRTKRIIVTGNHITKLGAIFRHNGQLQEIDFSENNLTTIPAGTFQGLGQLQTLNLEYNQLTTIPAGTFQGLEQLQHLDLRRNPWNSSSVCINSSSLPLLNDLRGVSFCQNFQGRGA
jgi:Leucine-rich repeat (LRR) protein